MDTFLDKLSQKLNAQEMIKANSAADAEQIQNLKAQMTAYDEFLQEVKSTHYATKLNVDKNEEINNATLLNTENIDKVNQSIMLNVEKTSKINQDTLLNAEKNGKVSQEILLNLEKTEKINRELQLKIEELIRTFENEIQKEDNEDAPKASLEDFFEQSNDFVHRENVKVYRNVQAVINEEAGKQLQLVEKANKELKRKMNSILFVALLAFLSSIASIVLNFLL